MVRPSNRPPPHGHKAPNAHTLTPHNLPRRHCVNTCHQETWQASHRSQGEPLPLGSGLKQYFASGSHVILQHAMEVCNKFEQTHTLPADERDLIVYCEELLPVLATINGVGAAYVGTVRNLIQATQTATHRQQRTARPGT